MTTGMSLLVDELTRTTITEALAAVRADFRRNGRPEAGTPLRFGESARFGWRGWQAIGMFADGANAGDVSRSLGMHRSTAATIRQRAQRRGLLPLPLPPKLARRVAEQLRQRTDAEISGWRGVAPRS